MYHIQTPPPDHLMDMSISGLSWVDMVFPIFIFCMGVAIPLAGNINPNISPREYTTKTFGRFLGLWLFSYLYALTIYTDLGSVWAQLSTLLGFISLFLIYLKIPKKLKTNSLLIRSLGYTGIIATLALGYFFFDSTPTLGGRGIIIFLLAFIYLFGSLIWYFTRKSLKWRLIALLGILIITAITQYYNLPVISYANPNIRWWFNVEYIYFLLLLIPATIVGDIITKEGTCNITSTSNTLIKTSVPLLLITTPIFLITTLYLRSNIWIILAVSIATLLPIAYIFKSLKFNSELKFIAIAIILLVLGCIIEPIEGGIKKVPCTISYCFITAAMSIMLMIAIDFIYQSCGKLKYKPVKWLLAGAGANPLMAYIAFSNLIMPLMNTTGLVILWQISYSSEVPITGFIRAFVMTIISLAIVATFSSKKIYWKA